MDLPTPRNASERVAVGCMGFLFGALFALAGFALASAAKGRDWSEHIVEVLGAVALWALASAVFLVGAIGVHPKLAENRRFVAGVGFLILGIMIAAKVTLIIVKWNSA